MILIRRISLARREALEKSQRTDGESTATGSTTPSANSSSSLSSVGHETSSTTAEQSLSTSHHSLVCPTLPSNNTSESSTSDLSLANQSAHSPNYIQQPLALTTNKSISMNTNYRKETFPINHIRQHLIPGTANNNSIAPYLKS